MITCSDYQNKGSLTMSGKYGWHKAWKFANENQLIHDSGLRVNVINNNGVHILKVDVDSIQDFKNHEATKIAMQPQDLENRFKRLQREAKDYWDRAQERKVKHGNATTNQNHN